MDLNTPQRRIIVYIQEYVKANNKAVSKKDLLNAVDNPRMLYSYLSALIRKGYLKRAIVGNGKYILLRTVGN